MTDTRQKFTCAKCGKTAFRKYETSDYCMRCWKLENKFDRLIEGGNEILSDESLCDVGVPKMKVIV